MNIWEAFPWAEGGVSVMIDFFAFTKGEDFGMPGGLFSCKVQMWMTNSATNTVSCFIDTSHSQRSLGGTEPSILNGELFV